MSTNIKIVRSEESYTLVWNTASKEDIERVAKAYERISHDIAIERATPIPTQSQLTKRIFIRLYNPVYKSSVTPAAFLKKAIEFVDEEAIDSVNYFHSSISTKLKDDFVGCTSGGQFAAKLESVLKPGSNFYMRGCDPAKSMYAVFEIPVSVGEQTKIRNILKASLKTKLNYDVLSLGLMGMHMLFNKFESEESYPTISVESALKYTEELQKHNNFVCSTFIAFIIITCIKRLTSEKKVSTADYRFFTPNALTRLVPGCRKIFSGVWSTYADDVAQFVKQNPKYREYM